jgi:hypothetical protein
VVKWRIENVFSQTSGNFEVWAFEVLSFSGGRFMPSTPGEFVGGYDVVIVQDHSMNLPSFTTDVREKNSNILPEVLQNFHFANPRLKLSVAGDRMLIGSHKLLREEDLLEFIKSILELHKELPQREIKKQTLLQDFLDDQN